MIEKLRDKPGLLALAAVMVMLSAVPATSAMTHSSYTIKGTVMSNGGGTGTNASSYTNMGTFGQSSVVGGSTTAAYNKHAGFWYPVEMVITFNVDNGVPFANTTSVTLYLICSDRWGGCSQMKVSNDNASWSTPEAYNATKIWTLDSGEGARSVYVQFRNNTGYWTDSLLDTITLAPYRITGRIINRLDLPVPYAPVKVKMSGGRTMISSANPGGNFAFDYIVSGDYKITTRLLGYRFTPKFITVSGADVDLKVRSEMSMWDQKYSEKYYTDQSAPDIPSGVSANASSSTEIELKWTVPQDNVSVSGFRIFNDVSEHVGTAVTSYYRLTGLDSGVEYCFRVSAFDGVGNESAQSSQVCATTP